MIQGSHAVIFFPVAVQGVAIFVDEFYFHHKRGLPAWEKIGHPLDTLISTCALLVPFFLPFSEANLLLYICVCLFSCFFVTKDEWIHSKVCCAAENWLHAVLFLMHPLVFVSFGFLWWDKSLLGMESKHSFDLAIRGQLLAMSVFGFYQYIYWNFIRVEN